MWWLALSQEDKPDTITDRPVSLKCPKCGDKSNFIAVSTPRWGLMRRYEPSEVIVGYRCGSCKAAIALRYKVRGSYSNNIVELSNVYEELERPMETFDYQHLPADVASDFKEALTSYSHSCWNASAAMCRRTIQSVAMNLGAEGTDKVSAQIVEVKNTADMDDETYTALRAVMLGGHDGSHPHLPAVSPQRAAVLVEMMKDVLTQIYVRKGRIQAAMKLRQEAIAEKKGT